jgi:hypothetical protein
MHDGRHLIHRRCANRRALQRAFTILLALFALATAAASVFAAGAGTLQDATHYRGNGWSGWGLGLNG